MTDYISRSDALNFDMSVECEPDELSAVMEGMARVMDYIKQIPAADVVEVVHGEWKPCSHYDSDTHMICECSVCGDTVWVYYNSEREWNYCPNCGAKMDGGDHDG